MNIVEKGTTEASADLASEAPRLGGVPRTIQPAEGAHNYQLLIKQLLLSGVRYQPKQEIVYSDKIRYSYSTLLERIRRLANVLTQCGVRPGDTVGLLDWDSHRALECFFAVPMLGAVLHTVNVRLSAEQICFTMNHATDRLVLVHDDFIPLMKQLRKDLISVKGFVRLTEVEAPDACEELNVIGDYESLLSGASDKFEFPDFDENSVATLFYTTGTTGAPKGVYFTHRQLVLHTLGEISAFSATGAQPVLRSGDVYMPITPMFHVHAWGVPYLATTLGIKQVYPGRYEPRHLVNLLRKEGVTFSHCVPTILQMILECVDGRSADMNGWKVLVGGSALTMGLATKASDRGIQVLTGYGMSETCPLVSMSYLDAKAMELPLEQQLQLRISAGLPVPLVDLRVVDEEGNDVSHDGESLGEIVVRAPWLTQGYVNEPAQGEALWAGGWLHTGDVACIGSDGVVQIRDRIKDVIKSGGEWISSVELEDLISQHSEVESVAVVGIPDERWGEQPLAWIVRVPNSHLDQSSLAVYLQQYVVAGRLSKWAIPRQVRFVPSIPKTSVGKINKRLIRETGPE
ncbi:fatty acid--CoA ligase [Stenotrophomonas maltophilia]|uniref:fatty acid--CoA ligase n=1 Tax=Stenotrophomonas maltophilia TaxID=40324 RepID=UPI003BF8D2B9